MRAALPISAIVLAKLAVAPALAQGQERAVIVAERQNGTPVELSRDQRLVVQLAMRAGTRFSWTPAAAPADGVLRLAKSETKWGPSMLGAAAAQIFTFVPLGPGTADVEFSYRRPWLKHRPPAHLQASCRRSGRPVKRFSRLGEGRRLG
jgi:predicted secreted protein